MGQSGIEKGGTTVTANNEMKRAGKEDNRHQERLKAFVSESVSNYYMLVILIYIMIVLKIRTEITQEITDL
jgi:hypothetical protein